MEAIRFAKELKRMCKSHKRCSDCPIYKRDISCDIQNLEETLPIVEEWSKEHSFKTNLDHYAEKLQEVGYEVDKERLRNTCPAYKCDYFAKDKCKEHVVACTDCRKWWDEEYKEQKE